MIISKLTFSLNDLSITISREKLLEKLKVITDDKDIFGNKENRLFLGFNDTIADNSRKYLGLLNSIFHNYGLCIRKIDNIIYDSKTKNNIHNYSYQLNYYDIFYSFL